MRVAFGEREEVFLPQVTVARVQQPPTGSMRKMSVCRVGSSREELGWELSTIATTDELRILAHTEIRRGVWHRKCNRNLSAIMQQ